MIVFCALVLSGVMLRVWLRPRKGWPSDSLSGPELMLAGSFLFYPALLVVLTKLLGSGYVPRYGWPAILGLMLWVAYLLGWSVQPVTYLAAALLIVFALDGAVQLRVLANADPTKRWTALMVAGREKTDIPIVIANGRTYLEADEYAPREVHGRLVEVVDSDMARRSTHMDALDRGNPLLGRYVPLHIEERAVFEPSHPQFILCSSGMGDWLTQYLIDKKYRLILLAQSATDYSYSLYLVNR